MTALVLLVAIGAVYRLTMLVVADKLTEEPREAVLSTVTGHGYLLHDALAVPGAWQCRCGVVVTDEEDLADHVAAARGGLVGWRHRVCYLIECPWCVSWWVAAIVMSTGWAFGDRSWWFVPAAALTASAVTGTWARYVRPGR